MRRETLDPLPIRRTVVLSLLAFAAICATGCGAARPSKYYQLTVPPDSARPPDPNPFPCTILIGRMTAPALYREDQIVYSSGSESMGTYEYERWAEPPTEMIQEIVLRQMRSSGHYRGVYLLRSDIHGDFLLHGHLYDFREVSAGSLAARVTMEFELRDIKSHSVVWAHFYTHDEPSAQKDVSGVVAAMDKNVQQGVAQMLASLDQYFTAHPPAPSAP
jgi:cholesterol transport system auxiliary component